MTLSEAMRLTEILLSLAFLQQSAEHVFASRDFRALFIPRAVMAIVLLVGVAPAYAVLGLCLHSLAVLHRFQGPYNGGSDRMGLLILYCLCMAHWLPGETARQAAFGYLAVQVVLSYFISGQVKIVNPDWRSGQALRDVFVFSAYPVSQDLRRMADHPRLLWAASWAVMLFEVVFPFSVLHQNLLIVALFIAAMFHISNACFFGLNRFVWFWIASYPSILWLQDRLILGG